MCWFLRVYCGVRCIKKKKTQTIFQILLMWSDVVALNNLARRLRKVVMPHRYSKKIAAEKIRFGLL